MVGPSKILTVSYGTFSCTLEGFEDPFSTMRGISEYFRDLAAEDRYFGAEPPTPDAEMLHRIAEREVQRRVEAHVDDGGVTLRQLDTEETIEDEAEPAASAVAPALAAVRAAAQVEIVEEAAPKAPKPPVDTESVAAKLARIRAVVSDNATPETSEEYAGEEYATSTISAAFDDVTEFEVEVEEETPETDVAAILNTQPVEVAEAEVEDVVEPEVAIEEETSDINMMADVEVAEVEVEAEDEAPETDIAAFMNMQPIEVAEAEVEAEEVIEPEVAIEEETSDINVMADVETEVEAEAAPGFDEAEAEPEVEDVAFEAPWTDEVEETAEEIAEVEIQAEELAAEADTSDDAVSRMMVAVSATPAAADTEELEETTDAVEEPDPSAIARVVKMRRSDFEAAVAEGNLEEVSEETTIDLEAVQNAIEEPAEPQSSLSAEDEAELMSTLEQVQREAEAERRAEKEGRAMMENADIEADTNSVSRILDVTNSEMEETEGTRRRSAIAHLKAAVAATRADKFLSKKRADEQADEMNQYRNDLARVVRPKRPPEAKNTGRRMAPLMLVSEQRIDSEDADPITDAAASVVRPSRVTSVGIATEEEVYSADGSDENIFRDAGSFAEFAEEMGASELPDLLEAAAAYYAFVEGRAHFSRPQIMNAVASVNEEKVYSREEGLRSFGMLLRRGKIEKIKRGQFKISNSTRFNPEARAAGE